MPSTQAVTFRDAILHPQLGDPDVRIDGLRELRAVIDALRHEQEARDPLLAWVLDEKLAPRS